MTELIIAGMPRKRESFFPLATRGVLDAEIGYLCVLSCLVTCEVNSHMRWTVFKAGAERRIA